MAPPTDGTMKRLELYKAHKIIYSPWKQRPNRCIIGDAIIPQTGKKIDQKCGLEFGGLLWRHLTPHQKTAI